MSASPRSSVEMLKDVVYSDRLLKARFGVDGVEKE